MLTGAAWNNPANRVASDPVVLQPGEDKSVSIKIRIAADNTNLLTLIRLDEDAEALNFAVSMAVENSTASRPATITLNLPEGFKVAASYKTQVNTNDKLVLPTDEQITNETGHRIIRWVDEDGNVVDGNTVLNEDITIKPELTQNATITVVMPDGLAVASDYKTDIQTGDMLVVPTSAQITGTIPNGRTLLGWYNTVSGEIIGDKYMVTETAIEIAPYFSKTEGVEKGHDFTGNDADFNGKDLVFGNEQGTGKPQNVKNGDVTKSDAFLGLTSTERYTNTLVVAGGEGKYAELGRMIGYNGTYVAGGTFRYATKVGGNAPVKINTPHTFRFNFQNFGTGALDFTIQGVNQQTNVEGPAVRVQLQPGESTTVSYTVSFSKGSNNNNVMTYFTFNEEAVNFRLGVSINVTLNSSTVTLNDGVEGVTLSADYLEAVRRSGDTLTLPTVNDYVNTTGKEIVGWKDAGGNALTNETVLGSTLKLVPVFAEEGV